MTGWRAENVNSTFSGHGKLGTPEMIQPWKETSLSTLSCKFDLQNI